MATRIYIDANDFDALKGHFTIEVVDNQYYLKIGALNGEDQRLIGSLIDDGFVGFFQDEVRIAIAGIVSTYDAENDRIEIDRDPELQIEDAYVIRFTQARPGEDGEGGIGTPGDDGEHAEIEIEDTNTGIRVRGKSGGEPDFGPWQDVRDGIDGEPGQDGEDGQDGEPGKDGNDGEDGDDGWSPKFATVPDGERRVLQVADWFGGGGTKPDVGQYVGETGFVAAIAEAVDIRGPAGEDGEDGTGICTALTVLNDPTGTQNLRTVELPANYTDYDNIYFNIFGTNEFRQNSLKISTLVNGRRYRVGGISDIVWNESSRTFRLDDGRTAGNFRHVILTGCEDDGGDSNDGEDGWSPKFAIKSDGERRVLQVVDWFGGSGIKPVTGKYIGLNSFVDAIADGVDIRGPKGQDGQDGQDGRDGQDGEPGPEGPQGPAGGDLGTLAFSKGDYEGNIRNLHMKGSFNGGPTKWIHRDVDPNFVNVEVLGGRWIRIENVVQYYACFQLHKGSSISRLDRVTLFMDPPHGSSNIGHSHGLGNQITEDGGWFPMEINAGRWQSTVDNDGNLEDDGQANAVTIICRAADSSGLDLGSAIAIHGIYTVVP